VHVECKDDADWLGIWRVLACPMRMLNLGIIGNWKSLGTI